MSEFWAGVKFLNELLAIGRALYDDFRVGRREGWIEDGRDIAKAYKEAKTDDERFAALRRLVGHRASLPR